MQINDHQNRLLSDMIQLINGFRAGEVKFCEVVGGLEGAFYAGEFRDSNFRDHWFDLWIPLEIYNATKGNKTTIEEVDDDLINFDSFLRLHYTHIDEIC